MLCCNCPSSPKTCLALLIRLLNDVSETSDYGHYRGNLTEPEMFAQIEYLIQQRYPSGFVPSEQFKIQLFRFIDVLPALQTDEQFVRLLHEYFHDVRSLPSALHWLLTRSLKNPIMARVGTRIL